MAGPKQRGNRKRKLPFRPHKKGGKKANRDKEVFKRRKYLQNNYVVDKEAEIKDVESSSSSEEECDEYSQLLQVYNSGAKPEQLLSDPSDEESDGDDADQAEGSDEDDIDEEEDDQDENELSAGEEEGQSDEDAEAGSDLENGEEAAEEGVMEEEGENEEVPNADDNDIHAGDPFTLHFERDLSPEVVTRLQAGSVKWKPAENGLSDAWDSLGSFQTLVLDAPTPDEDDLKKHAVVPRERPGLLTSLEDLHIRQKLRINIDLPQNKFEIDGCWNELMSVMSDYRDLYWPERTCDNGETIRFAYTTHALNHVIKTRNRILKNNARHEQREEGDDSLRDQGLTRPKVLIVVPFKESCRRIVSLMEKLLFPEAKGNVVNKKRFNEEFAELETEFRNKPQDFQDTFKGDIGDSFKLGLAITRKTIKLYTDFYNSDIIITSPLGLRLVLGIEGEKDRNYDFLNSIEVLIMDQADIFMMQNWDHILTLLDSLHLQPAQSRGVDFSRVRLWTLDGLNKFYRQTMVFSAYPTPELNAVFSKNCQNFSGKVRVQNPVVSSGITQVLSEVPLVFHRVDTASPRAAIEDRFNYFTQKIIPSFMRDEMDHVLVYVSNYCDFVKVRNWFKSSNLDYADICEYTKENKIAEARDDFYHNSKHFLLYTERAHFYRRFLIKGIRHIIFYQMPQNPVLFVDLCNLQQLQFQNRRGGSDSNMSCTAIYTKFDACRLSLSVGNERASVMIAAQKSKHKFSPGG